MNGTPRILLDGQPDEELRPPGPGSNLLGRDPFEEPAGPDPFSERLDALGWETLPDPAAARAPAAPARTPRPPTRRPGLERPRRRSGDAVPRVAEVEAPAPGVLERWIDEDARRRLAALAPLAETASGYDRFGLSAQALRQAFPFFYALYRWWFRVRSEGHDRLPERGGAVLAGNHAGLLPFDGAMTVVDLLLHTDPPRLARAVVDRWAGNLPWVNVFFARVGQVIGTPENFDDLLEDGQCVLVFPEGMHGIRKRVTQRYRLQTFHVGFVERALRARVPIVPVAIVGSEDQAPILYDVKPVARALGLPFAPITPTFPWLGPLGLLPYPVSYRIVYGEPLPFHEKFGPEAAEDVRLVRYLANQVRRSVQQLLDRSRG